MVHRSPGAPPIGFARGKDRLGVDAHTGRIHSSTGASDDISH